MLSTSCVNGFYAFLLLFAGSSRRSGCVPAEPYPPLEQIPIKTARLDRRSATDALAADAWSDEPASWPRPGPKALGPDRCRGVGGLVPRRRRPTRGRFGVFPIRTFPVP